MGLTRHLVKAEAAHFKFGPKRDPQLGQRPYTLCVLLISLFDLNHSLICNNTWQRTSLQASRCVGWTLFAVLLKLRQHRACRSATSVNALAATGDPQQV